MKNTVYSEPLTFYLWQHKFVDCDTDAVLTRTCFGITTDIDQRQNSYEGHVGHEIRWAALWTGPERQIRELEHRLKSAFRDYLVSGHNDYVYEWVDESQPFETIRNWVEWEVAHVFADIKKA